MATSTGGGGGGSGGWGGGAGGGGGGGKPPGGGGGGGGKGGSGGGGGGEKFNFEELLGRWLLANRLTFYFLSSAFFFLWSFLLTEARFAGARHIA